MAESRDAPAMLIRGGATAREKDVDAGRCLESGSVSSVFRLRRLLTLIDWSGGSDGNTYSAQGLSSRDVYRMGCRDCWSKSNFVESLARISREGRLEVLSPVTEDYLNTSLSKHGNQRSETGSERCFPSPVAPFDKAVMEGPSVVLAAAAFKSISNLFDSFNRTCDVSPTSRWWEWFTKTPSHIT